MKTLALLFFSLLISGIVMAQSYDTVRLSSLDLDKASTGWGIIGYDKSCMGNPISVGGVHYAKGFGTHANSKLYIKTNGAQQFHAILGVDDEEKNSTGTIEFQLMTSNALLWKSNVLKSGGVSQELNFNVSEIDTLILIVTRAGDGITYDHADWADAYFLVKGEKPFSIDIPYVPGIILTPKPSDEPRINGPKIYGARPGHDFLYKIPVTGVRPIRFSVKGLPEGLSLDPHSGIIQGTCSKAGKYLCTIKAENSKGTAKREFTIVIGNQIALTPPMGWNSWNCFACSVTGDQVKSAADAMIRSGLADHGWTYINIDDCWMREPESNDPVVGGNIRNANGDVLTNAKFGDIRQLTDYIHSLGLKAGIYSGPGPKTCAGYTACYQHEVADARMYAQWGFDYLKYDWCDYERIAKDHSLPELKKPYFVMRDALDKADRDIVYSLCQYGMGDVWEWGAEVGGNCWRTTGDIFDDWSSVEEIGFSQAGHEKYAGPGHWNDPDMLVVGKVGWGPKLHMTRLTPDEQYSHISLWALLSAPLLIGCDMTQLDEFTLSLLTNDEVLEVNQDILGNQAGCMAKYGDVEIWAKKLEDGSMAVGVFNRGLFSTNFQLSFDDLGMKKKLSVRDLWQQKDLGKFTGSYFCSIPSHGVKLLKVR